MKISTLLMLLLLQQIGFAQPWQHGKLKISENGHYLQFADGTPFFWLGDTGWEMLHKTSREDMEMYLENRRNKGFNIIQTVILGEFYHMDTPVNFYGDSLFHNDNVEKPFITPGNDPLNTTEYDYWDHIDYAVKTAEKKGLFLALVPSWGEWVVPRVDKALFNTRAQAYKYGFFVGNRYRNSPNIIWILGGDRLPDERKEGVDLWRAMAEGIADGVNGQKNMDGKADYTTTLMTHHCYNSSSNWFHNDDWIDLHMWGSYHAEVDNNRAYELALTDWNLSHPKPTLNGEPCYEGADINYALEDNGVFTSTDVRTAAYWSVFSGCTGFTYGCNVWQFNDPIKMKNKKKHWKEELELPGALQVQLLKKLMESRPMLEMMPDQSMLINSQGSCASHAAAIRGKSHAFIYIPTGNKTIVKLGLITGKKIKAWWYNPRNGKATVIGEFDNTGEQSFEVPGMSEDLAWLRSGRGCDWVLVLDDISRNYPANIQ